MLVPAALRELRAARPEVAVSMVEGLSTHLMDGLGRAEIDIAVVSDHPSGLGAGPEVEVTRLMEDELLVALPGGHPLAGRARVDLRDLRDESWIEGAPPGTVTMLGAACARAGFAPRIDLRIAEWTGKLGYVAAGLGVTLVPAMAAPAVRPDVALCSLGELAPRRTVYAALPRTAALPAASALLGLLGAGAGLPAAGRS